MRNVLIAGAFLAAVSVSAESVFNKDATTSDKKEESFHKSLPKIFQGCSVGIGANIGLQRASSDINRNFDTPFGANSTVFGGTATIGYQRSICGKCFLGIEAGVDFGSSGKGLKISGRFITQSAVFQNYRGTLQQLLLNVAENIDVGVHIANVEDHAIDASVWQSFAKTMRYIGGNTNQSLNDINTFIASPADPNKMYDFADNHYQGNPNAVFSNFAPEASVNLKKLGDGNVILGLRRMRDFIGDYFPKFGLAMAGIAELNVGASGVGTGVPETAVGSIPAKAVTVDAARNIAFVLKKDYSYLTSFKEHLGIAEESPPTPDEFTSDMNRIYDPMAEVPQQAAMSEVGDSSIRLK